MKRDQILKEMDEYIDRIAKPISESDAANGWDASHQQSALLMWGEIRSALQDRPHSSVIFACAA